MLVRPVSGSDCFVNGKQQQATSGSSIQQSMPGASQVSVRDVALAGLRIDEASIEKVPKKFWTERDLAMSVWLLAEEPIEEMILVSAVLLQFW